MPQQAPPFPPFPAMPRTGTPSGGGWARRLRLGCLATMAAWPAMAQAQTTPATPSAPIEAAALQAQLRGWVASLLAPALTLPEPPITVTRDGTRYVLTLPASTWSGPASDDITADLRRLDTGAWALEKLTTPSGGTIKTPPILSDDPADAVEARYQLGDRSVTGIIDPELRQPSSLNVDARDVILDMRVGPQKQFQRIDRYQLKMALVPGTNGRFDMNQEAGMSGWEASSEVLPGAAAEMGMRQGRVVLRIEDMRTDRLGTMFETFKELLALGLSQASPSATALLKPNGDKPSGDKPGEKKAEAKPLSQDELTEAVRKKAKVLVDAMRDLAARLEAEETLEDFSMTLPMVGRVSLAKFHFGMGIDTPDGRLKAWTELAMQDLKSEAIPPEMRDYVPSRLALRPVISGVPTETILGLLSRLTDKDPDFGKLEAELMGLLRSSDTLIGLESMAIDVAPLRLTGKARLRLFADDKAGIESQVIAGGMDALMAEANKKPELRMALPVLAMARGMARVEGDKLVWDIALSETQALVNGVDLFAMQAPPPEKKPQQRPQQRPNNR